MQDVVETRGKSKAAPISNSAKLLAGYMAATGETNARVIAEILDIPLRTVQRLKLEVATAHANSAKHAMDGASQSANSATDGVFDAPNAPPVAFSPSRVIDNNKLTNLEDSSEVKNNNCAILRLPTNPRAKGTAPRQRGSRDEFDIKFEQFWAVFPSGRKRAKGKCREAFIRIARGGHYMFKATAEQMIEAAQSYALTKPDPQFVPMPLTWLNQGRWEDDPRDSAVCEPAKAEDKPYDWSQAPDWMREEYELQRGTH